MIYCTGRFKHTHPLYFYVVVLFLLMNTTSANAQKTDKEFGNATLSMLIDFALDHQPAIKQSAINEEITELQIKNKLADWYPQVNFNYNYQRNFQLPTSVFGGNTVQLGVDNNSSLQLTASQNIFNRDALLARRTKEDVNLLAGMQTENTKINLVSGVSKNFYDLLATQQQIKVTDENIARLSRSLKDSRARYEAGLNDKTDFQRATIALNNAKASKKQLEESLNAKLANLKSLINYPSEKELAIQYDSALLEKEIYLDTARLANFSNRVEFQQLQLQSKLQQANITYNKWSYIPTVSANGAYLLNFLNNNFGKLYNTGYPNSYAGISLNFPIFQGGKRKNNIIIAQKQLDQTNLSITSFINQAKSEYANAMTRYKAGMANYLTLKENMQLAAEVVRIIELQYREGIKTYLELITAQTDLRMAQISYFNAIYDLLSSKIDVQKAEGSLMINKAN